tara:strand:+ start:5681 stop:6958 length:1278 start_codon:yes stop_codon:yes gene_type:complete
MAVKFSQFTNKTDFAEVDKLVGYTAAGDINVQIPPANLDTTYSFATAQDGNNVDLTLTGTKTGTTNTTEVLQFTAGTAMTLTAGTDEITITNNGVTSFTNSNGTYISAATANSNATGAVTTGVIDLSAVDGTADSNTRFLSKDNTWDVPAYPAGYTGWTVSDGSNSTAVASGDTVTFTGGTGITSTESTRTVTLAIDYAGADNAILAASAATVASADTIWFSDADDSTIKKGLVSDLPFNETLQEVCTAGNTTTTAILAGDGTVSLPSFAFTTEPDTGMYRSAANALALVTGGAAALTIDANQNGTFNSTGATTLPVGDDAARPTPANGMIRYSTTSNGFEGYINGAWGSIGGGVTKTVDQVTISNATTGTVALSVSPTSEAYTDMYVSGVYQNKSVYSLSGSTITLDSSAYFPNGSIVEVVSTT